MRNAGPDEAQNSSRRNINMQGEISKTSDMQMTPPLWQKVKRNKKSLDESESGEWKSWPSEPCLAWSWSPSLLLTDLTYQQYLPKCVLILLRPRCDLSGLHDLPSCLLSCPVLVSRHTCHTACQLHTNFLASPTAIFRVFANAAPLAWNALLQGANVTPITLGVCSLLS